MSSRNLDFEQNNIKMDKEFIEIFKICNFNLQMLLLKVNKLLNEFYQVKCLENLFF